MAKLFTITPDGELELNKEWILMIPEFATILRKDKGSEGDYRGDKKLKAKRQLAYVFLMHDFSSPLRAMNPFDKRTAAMKDTSLTEEDINEDLMAACERYNQLQLDASRALKSLTGMYKALDAIDDYFYKLDMGERDKKGEAVNNIQQVIKSTGDMKNLYKAIKEFEQMVDEELTQDSGIRGAGEKGDREGKQRTYEYNGQKGHSAKVLDRKEVKSLGGWRAAAEQIRLLEQEREAHRPKNPVDALQQELLDDNDVSTHGVEVGEEDD